MAELASVQAWMQRAILAGGAVPEFAEGIVTGDETLDAASRVAIYARGYRARLIESLREEYPALRRLAGDTAFDLFAADYIAAHPSHRPSLYDYGAGFADHLAERAPAMGREPGSLLAIPAQLARLERARAEVARARAEAGPARPGAPLRLADSVRLLRLDFDFSALIEAVARDAPAPAPVIEETRLAVTRIGWRVRMLTLDEERFAFLEAASAAPVPVPDDLVSWLPIAGRLGLLTTA